MPKINPVVINEAGPGDLRFMQAYETHVLADGTFQTRIPDDHLAFLKAMSVPAVSIEKNKTGAPVLKSRSLDEISRMLRSYGKAQMATTKTRETLIVFTTTMSIAYCTTPTLPGRIFENGQLAKDASGLGEKGEWRWHGKNLSNQSTTDKFAVGVCARVIDKIVHTLPNSRFHVEHEIYRGEEGSWAAKLNTFNGSVFPPVDYWSKEDPNARRYGSSGRKGETLMEQDGLQFIPYTEEAAEFFHSMMYNLCTLAERMRLFFGEDKQEFLANVYNPDMRRALAAPEKKTVVGNAELDAGVANHFDPNKRGFSPR